MLVKEINDTDLPSVQLFFKKCKQLKFMNNISKEAIKFEWVKKKRKGVFYSLFIKEHMIGMAGCHWFPEISNRSFRIQFRGCEIPGTDEKNTLSRSFFNSSTFRELIPYQLNWIRNKISDKCNAYITTNHGHKNHRAMELLAKQGLLTKLRDELLFGVNQTIWRFNIQKYNKIRNKTKSYVHNASEIRD